MPERTAMKPNWLIPAIADAINGAAPVATANIAAAVNSTSDTFNRPLILVTVDLR
jgi:hypothetical protein